MEKNALSISLLGGQFKAAALQRGSIAGTFERSEPVDDLAVFPAALDEAVKKTGSDARRMVMVLAHPRLSMQIVEIPPVSGGTLDRYIHRRAQNLKSFDGEATWSMQPAMPGKNSKTVLLHLLPKSVIDQLTAGCESASHQLVRVIPTAAILAAQLKQLPIAEHEIALLAAETGRTTTVVIGTRSGEVCLTRVLGSNWNRKPEGFAMDLDRTMGFLNQESGLMVNNVWLFGAGAEAQTVPLAATLNLPVQVSPVAATPFYWAEQAARLPDEDDGNLISTEIRQAPQRRQMLAATVLMTALVCLGSLATAGYCEHLRRNNLATLERITKDTPQLQARLQQSEQREAASKHNRGFSEFVRQEALPPVPGWFLGYIGEVMPENLVLTQLHVTRLNNQWQINLSGNLQPAEPSSADSVWREDFSRLTNSLATGPFHVKITRGILGDTGANFSSGSPGMAAKPGQFLIEGVMQ